MLFKKKSKEAEKAGKDKKVENDIQLDKEVKELKEMKLMFISDRDISVIPEYFRSFGVPIYNIFESLEEIKIELMISSNNILLVVVDSGRGKFNSTKGRDDLLDTLGMCNGEKIESIVFYTDSNIKALEKHKDLKTTWMKYESTLKVAEYLKKLNYKFTEGTLKNSERLGLDYKGHTNDKQSSIQNIQYMSDIDNSIYNGIDTEGELIESFNVVY